MEMEERKRQEALLQQELSQRQEANLQLNEQFASLREEARGLRRRASRVCVGAPSLTRPPLAGSWHRRR